MNLKDKFPVPSHYDFFIRKCSENPAAAPTVLVVTPGPVGQWPEDMEMTLHTPGAAAHVYAVRTRPEALERFCSHTAVLRLSL